ncbi:MAG TPA: isochorismatase family cysteine hydrolase [bacterium]|nr:isochorismatase family cysteine hydrolase [bacterium]
MSWRNNLERVPGIAPKTLDLGRTATALVIVDMQYLDAHRDYGLGKSLQKTHPRLWRYYFDRIERVVVPNAKRLLHAFRRGRMRVIHLTLGPELQDGADFVGPDAAFLRQMRPSSSPGFFHKETFEHRILPDLAPVDGELVVNKTSRSAFTSTALERTLLNLRVRTVIVVGVATSACVDLTARDAVDRGFGAVIVEDATADLDEVLHEAALRQFVFRWGRVWTCEETLRALRRRGEPAGASRGGDGTR